MKQLIFLIAFIFISFGHVFSQCTPSFTYQADTSNFVVFTNLTPPNSAFSYRWDFGDSSPIDTNYNPSHQYSNNGSYVVTLSIDSATVPCGTIVDTIYVNFCNAYFSTQINNDTVQFQNFSTTSSIAYYSWDFGDNNTSSQKNPTHKYQLPGQYAIFLYVYDSLSSCFSAYTDSVTIAPPCQAGFNFTTNKDFLFIQNQASNFQLVNYDFGDSTNSSNENPVHVYSQSGTYLVCQTVTDTNNNCTDTFCDTVNITIPPPCQAGFNFTTNKDSLFIQNQASNFQLVNYDFGDSTNSSNENPVHIYSQSGTYLVCQTVTDTNNNCTDTFCDTVNITIPPPCQAGFNFTTNKDSLFIQNQASNFQLVNYDFGDSTNSSNENPVHVYSQSGTYVVCQTVIDTNNNCTDTFCDTVNITIPPPCQAGFNFTTNKDSLFIQNQASNFQLVNYDFGDSTNSSNENPVHVYSQSGTYVVCQTVTDTNNNCTDTFCDTVNITIPPPCQANFSFSVNEDTLFIQNNAANYQLLAYDFGDGDTSMAENPFHIYSQSGTYLVCQTVEDPANNCIDVFCDTITINIPPPCQAGFSYQFQGDSTFFQNTAVNYDSLIYFFGDGNTSTLANPIHQYTNSGEYMVEQRVFNHRNCVSTFIDTIQVTISTSCVAKFEVAIDTARPSTLFLVNSSSNDNTNQYFWDFGDGNTSSQKNPTHQFAENKPYPICLTVSDTTMNCTSIYCDTVGLDSNGGILKSPGFTLKVIDGSVIGIEEHKNKLAELVIYPNPANEFIKIKWPPKVYELDYQLIGSNGQTIKTGRLHKNRGDHLLQLHSIDAGLYWLVFTSNEIQVIRKLIKQ